MAKYEIGDKVRIKSLDWYNENKDEYGYIDCGSRAFFTTMSNLCGKIATIKEISKTNCYRLEEYDFDWTDEMIECKVEEEEIEFTEEDKYWCDIMSESDPTTYVLPQGYQFVDENGNVINATKIVLEKKKKEYPKTYEECCKILGVDPDNFLTIRNVHCYDGEEETIKYEKDLLDKFDSLWELRICRDAYWKIAGDEMGLGKPWKPNWTSFEGYPAIYMYRYQITLSVAKDVHHCLVFPTEEMRDAFYENFKELIESVKELL